MSFGKAPSGDVLGNVTSPPASPPCHASEIRQRFHCRVKKFTPRKIFGSHRRFLEPPLDEARFSFRRKFLKLRIVIEKLNLVRLG